MVLRCFEENMSHLREEVQLLLPRSPPVALGFVLRAERAAVDPGALRGAGWG